MNNRSICVCAVLLIALGDAAFTQDTQARAEALLDRARQLSNIRSRIAPSFRLKATFTFAGADLDPVEGTYTEVWVSSSRWRREIAFGDSLRIEVGGSGTFWRSDKTPDLPGKAAAVPAVMQMHLAGSTKFEFESIIARPDYKPPVHCAITTAGSHLEKYGFCFEQKSGVLLEAISPKVRASAMYAFSCDYGLFKKFGNYWFPRQIICYEDRHKIIEAQVVDLAVEPTPDAALFEAPAGSVQLGDCTESIMPPVALSNFPPRLPLGIRDRPDRVAVSLVVDPKGRPKDLKVLRPGNKVFDQVVLSAVREWRFKPATCNGDPTPAQIEVQVEFGFFP